MYLNPTLFHEEPFVGLSHNKLRKLIESVPESKRVPLRRRAQ